ncbi:MAG: hypothetical protein IPJ46_21600 [Anaerolineales bacterium]|nr:hypothetical protein [Anaerolineales bacterium]
MGQALRYQWSRPAKAGLMPADIGYINAHGTCAYLNDKSEIAANKTVFAEQAYKIPVCSTKSTTGHLLGASAQWKPYSAQMAIINNILPPTNNY